MNIPNVQLIAGTSPSIATVGRHNSGVINNKLAAGQSVVIPEGIYYVNKPLLIYGKNNVYLRGVGDDISTLQWAGNSYEVVVDIAGSRKCGASDIGMSFAAPAKAGARIRWADSGVVNTQNRVQRVQVNSTYYTAPQADYGILIDNASGIGANGPATEEHGNGELHFVEDCTVLYSKIAGYYAGKTQAHRNVFNRCQATGNPIGFDFRDSGSQTMYDCGGGENDLDIRLGDPYGGATKISGWNSEQSRRFIEAVVINGRLSVTNIRFQGSRPFSGTDVSTAAVRIIVSRRNGDVECRQWDMGVLPGETGTFRCVTQGGNNLTFVGMETQYADDTQPVPTWTHTATGSGVWNFRGHLNKVPASGSQTIVDWTVTLA